MSITANDIARSLGLAQSTVSQVLAATPNHPVAANTRYRIENAAAEMGYCPNTLARSLRTRRTNTIGFFTSVRQNAPNPPIGARGRDGAPTTPTGTIMLPADFWMAMRQSCDAHDLDLLIHTNRPGASPHVVFSQIAGGRTDGAIVYLDADSTLRRYLSGTDLPIVSLGPLTGIAGVPLPDDLNKIGCEGLWLEVVRNAVAVLVHKIGRVNGSGGCHTPADASSRP